MKSTAFTFVALWLGLCFQTAATAAPEVRADFNGDGYTDLAVGVPGEDVNGVIDAGAVQVFYGSADGITTTNSQFWTLASPNVQLVLEAGDRFGSALAAGDFNHDGKADLAIGIPFTDNKAGRVLVLYGSSSGLTATGNQVWDQDILEDSREAGDQFGSALAAGDFNGDGYSDLAIGVPKEDFPDVGPPTTGIPICGVCLDAGIVNLVYGGPAGLTVTGNEIWHQDRGVTDYDGWVEYEDCFGASLAAGDFDHNGADDLAVGAVCENTGGADVEPYNNGAVSVYYGTPGVGLTGVEAGYLRQWHPAVVGFPQRNDAFGYALAAGDFNGDGYTDLAIGVPGEEADTGSTVDEGAVAVFYGGATRGLSPYDASRNELWYRDRPGVLGVGTPGARWGTSLAAGDFNGDGYDDVAVAAPFDTVDGVTGAGSVSILYGSAARLTSTGNQLLTQNSTGILDSAEQNDWFGLSLTAGDFNGDGVSDLAVGVPFEDVDNVDNTGAVNILYGRSNSGITSAGNAFLYQNSAGVLDSSEPGDEFGGRLLPQLFQNPWPNQPPNIIGEAGPLYGAVASAPDKVNLTFESTVDWVHWGLDSASDVNRMAGVVPQISNITPFGEATPGRVTVMSTVYSWSNGTPVSNASTNTGLWVFNVGRGVEFTVPADTMTRTLKVFVGASSARGIFLATLSDGSALPYSATIDQPTYKNNYTVTLTYRAASAGQRLTVRYTMEALYQTDPSGWISIHAATLQGGVAVSNLAPVLAAISSKNVVEGQALSIALSATDTDGPPPLILSQTNTLPGNPAILTDNGAGVGQLNWTPAVGDAAGSPYSVTVTATDGLGASSSRTFSITVTPLGIPTGITASVDTFSDKVAASWASVSGATSYSLYRSTAAGTNGTVIASPTTTSYDDTSAIAGTDYFYSVRACNSSGCSPFSTQVPGRRAIAPPGASPAGLTASVGTFTDKVAMAWNLVSDATSYNLYRSTSAGNNGSLLASPAATAFDDTSAVAGTDYYYSVQACNSGGCSPFSTQVLGRRAVKVTPTAQGGGGGAIDIVDLFTTLIFLIIARQRYRRI